MYVVPILVGLKLLIYRYITNLYAEKVRNHLWIFIKDSDKGDGWLHDC